MPRLPLDWLKNPDPKRGIHVLTATHGWRYTPYDELAGLVGRTAALILDHTNGVQDAIAVCCDDPQNFAVGLSAGLSTGARVACLPPPSMFGRSDRYGDLIRVRLKALKPGIILCDTTISLLAQAADELCTELVVVPDQGDGSLLDMGQANQAALIQFTSGSTANGRSIIIDAPVLQANIDAIAEWIGLKSDDGTSSWLPFYHDMGLVGCLLTPLSRQNELWLMSPQQFIRSPQMWLNSFSAGATTTASPPFGYEQCIRRCDSEATPDLSQWRVAIIGAEPVRPHLLHAFAQTFGPHGFDINAFRPGYGLAEATLVVTGRRRSDRLRVVDLDGGSVRYGERVPLAPDGNSSAATVPLLSCGPPVLGCTVEIRGHGGGRLDEGYAGEIVVRGSSVGRYSAPEPAPTSDGTRFAEGQLWTGDLGFIRGGELFCIGRLGDGLKLRGVYVSAEMVEQHVANELALVSGSVIALLGIDGDTARLGLLVDTAEGANARAAGAAAEATLSGADVAIRVYLCPRRVFERTSSGKPRRRSMWGRLVAGGFDDYVAVEFKGLDHIATPPAGVATSGGDT